MEHHDASVDSVFLARTHDEPCLRVQNRQVFSELVICNVQERQTIKASHSQEVYFFCLAENAIRMTWGTLPETNIAMENPPF